MDKHNPLDMNATLRVREAAGRKVAASRDTEAADLKWLMSSRRGRRIVWRLLDQAGVFRLSFNTNAMNMAFAEGGRNAGLRILSQIHALCPQLYQVMVVESVADRDVSRAVADAPDAEGGVDAAGAV
jgi:hypothetical protein